MRVLYLRRLAERLRWLVQQTEESSNVERAKRFAKELAKVEASSRRPSWSVQMHGERAGEARLAILAAILRFRQSTPKRTLITLLSPIAIYEYTP